MPSIKAENLFGRTFGDASNIVKQNEIARDSMLDTAFGGDKAQDLTNQYAFNYDRKDRGARKKM